MVLMFDVDYANASRSLFSGNSAFYITYQKSDT